MADEENQGPLRQEQVNPRLICCCCYVLPEALLPGQSFSPGLRSHTLQERLPTSHPLLLASSSLWRGCKHSSGSRPLSPVSLGSLLLLVTAQRRRGSLSLPGQLCPNHFTYGRRGLAWAHVPPAMGSHLWVLLSHFESEGEEREGVPLITAYTLQVL